MSTSNVIPATVLLLNQLKECITTLVHQTSSSNKSFIEENTDVSRLCFILDKILNYGLKDVSIFGKTLIWDYFSCLPECLPSGDELISKIKTWMKTDLGRGRVFIRYALNEQSLNQYMEALMWNKEITNKYYDSHSVMADDEYSGMFLMLLESLRTLKFKLVINDPNLNATDYWSFVIPAKVVFNASPKLSEEEKLKVEIQEEVSTEKEVEVSKPVLVNSRGKKKQVKILRRSIKVSESPKRGGSEFLNRGNEEYDSSHLSGKKITYDDIEDQPLASESLGSVSSPKIEEHGLNSLTDKKPSLFEHEFNKNMTNTKEMKIETSHNGKLESITKDDISGSVNDDENVIQDNQKDPIVAPTLHDVEIKHETPIVESHIIETQPEVITPIHSLEPLTDSESPTNEVDVVQPSEIERHQSPPKSKFENSQDSPLMETIEDSVRSPDIPIEKLQSPPNEPVKIPQIPLEEPVKSPRESPQDKIIHSPINEKNVESLNNETIDDIKVQVQPNPTELNRIEFMSLDELTLKLSEIQIANDHRNMLRDLHNSIEKLVQNHSDNLTLNIEQSVNFLYHLETILTSGVRKTSLLKQWTFLSNENVDPAAALWACISRLKEVLPEGAIVVDDIKRKPLSTPHGLSRSFFHASLNRKELNIHIEAILKLKEPIEDMYNKDSFICNEKLMPILIEMLEVLSYFDFRLSCEDKEFDRVGYYQTKRKEFLLNSGSIRKSSSNTSIYDPKRYMTDSYSSIISPSYDVFPLSGSIESNGVNKSDSNSFIDRNERNDHRLKRSNDDQLDSYGSITNLNSPLHFYLSPSSSTQSIKENNGIDVSKSNQKVDEESQFSPESISDSNFNVFGNSFVNPRYRTTDFSPMAKTHVQTNLSHYKTQQNQFTHIKNRYKSDKNKLKDITSHMNDTKSSVIPFNLGNEFHLPSRILSHMIIPEYNPSEIYVKIKKGINNQDGINEVFRVNASGIHEIEQHITKFRNANPLDFFLFDDNKRKPFTKKLAICPDCEIELTDDNHRWCMYTGSYFCFSCHTNKTSIIPSRILNDWDFKEYKVSNFAISHIQNNKNLPVIDIKEIKGEFWHLSSPPAIGKINRLREKITRMSQFLRTCRLSESQLEQLDSRKHFIWSSTIWSLNDLVELHDGRLRPLLERIELLFRNHVINCEICKGKGFYCEICKSQEILFPFNDHIEKCEKCKSLFHKDCYKSITIKCPKCDRIEALRNKKPE